MIFRNNTKLAVWKKVALMAVVFSAFLFLSLAYNLHEIHKHAVEKALTEAQSIYELNLAYRRWNAEHGGVYVQVTKEYQPSPLLAVYPKRDITGTDGTKLTLVNPAIMTRRVHKILSKHSDLPIINKVTSLKYQNPDNAPDEWEAKALRSFEQGASEASEIVPVEGQPYLRLLKPHMTEEGCLTCHAKQGYNLGDVRGGLSVGVPMQPFLKIESRERKSACLSHAFIWLMGMTGIALLGIRLRRAEGELIESERKFRTLAESSSDWEYWVANDGSIIFMSPSSEKITGYAPDAFIRNPALISEIIHPADRPLWRRHLENHTEKCHEEALFRIISKDGSVKWLSHNCDPILDGDMLTGRRISSRDITEYKRFEEKLRESESKFRSLAEQSLVGIYILQDNLFKYVNPQLAAIFGYGPEEMIGAMGLADLAPPEDRRFFEKTLCDLERSEIALSRCEESRGRKKSGDVIYMEVFSSRTLYEGKPALIGILLDISDKKKLESQLLQAQKMEAVGQLAGGIAHDFNNMLTVIIGYGNMVKSKMKPDDPQINAIDQILGASSRAAQLTKGLLTFSRKNAINPEPVDLNNIVNRIEGLLCRLIGEDIELSTRLSPQSLIIMADAGQIEQVLVNLTTNARDAMPEGGSITIATQAIDLKGDFAKTHVCGKAGRYALVAVSDSGAGMDAKAREKIFEPFFTSKKPGKGTGLGLAIVYGIVKQHNGIIDVYSEPDTGTTFKIYLPVSDSAVDNDPGAAADAEPAGGAETILLAEDDDVIRKMTKGILADFGYQVIDAVDGKDAIAKYNAYADDIKLAILDVIMPGMNGREVYETIKTTRPDMKVLFISGYTADIMHKKGFAEERIPFLSKPVVPFDLLRKIREILDQQKNDD